MNGVLPAGYRAVTPDNQPIKRERDGNGELVCPPAPKRIFRPIPVAAGPMLPAAPAAVIAHMMIALQLAPAAAAPQIAAPLPVLAINVPAYAAARFAAIAAIQADLLESIVADSDDE